MVDMAPLVGMYTEDIVDTLLARSLIVQVRQRTADG
ncbi:hypothetical protein MY4824_002848 [Beauveria thailandica]